MQDLWDNAKKQQLKMTVSQLFRILFQRNLSWVILLWVITFCSICLVQLFSFVWDWQKYYKITEIKNGRLTVIFKSIALQS